MDRPEDDRRRVGQRIERLLVARSRRKTHLATHLGISKQHLHAVLSGARPGVDLLPQIAAFLEVSLESLTIGQDPHPSAHGGAPKQEDYDTINWALIRENQRLRAEIARIKARAKDPGGLNPLLPADDVLGQAADADDAALDAEVATQAEQGRRAAEDNPDATYRA